MAACTLFVVAYALFAVSSTLSQEVALIGQSSAATDGAPTPAQEMSINGPAGLAFDPRSEALFIVELFGGRLLRLDIKRNSITTIPIHKRAGEFPAQNVIEADALENLFIGNADGELDKLNISNGKTIVLQSSGNASDAGLLKGLTSMAIDGQGKVFVTIRHQLFSWGPGVGLQPVAGSGVAGFLGDSGLARNARLQWPNGITFDASGDIIVADYQNCRMRKIDAIKQIITTIAGTGKCGSSGDGGAAALAEVDYPSSPVIDREGNLFFIEGASSRVRRIDRNGSITTYVGTGHRGSTGDGGPAKDATLENPSGLAVDDQGNLYVADFVANRIRRVDAATQQITTVAGNGLPARIDYTM